ncbi:MAG: hypothetical protein RJAPGHWK_001567 [Candidatus Fervidibacter sp.]
MRFGLTTWLISLAVSIAFAQSSEMDIGLGIWSLDGNEHKLRQYATPAKGLLLNLFRYTLPSLSDRSGWLTFKGTERNDYRTEGNLTLLFGRSQWEMSVSRYRFFDTTPTIIPSSTRALREAATKFLPTQNFAIALRYSMDQQDHFFEAPKLPLRQRTRFWDAVAEGKLGDGQIRLGYTDFRYFDRTDIRPDTTIRRWYVNYLWMPDERMGWEASFHRFTIQQPFRPNSDGQALAISGDWSLSSVTDITLLLRRDKWDLPVVQNALVRERRLAIARFVHRWQGWTLQLGFRQQENERVRKDQSFVDVPRWRAIELRLSGRLVPHWRLTLRGDWQHLTHLPTMGTTDPRQLFWDDRRFLQLRLEGGSPSLNGYLALNRRRWGNEGRAIKMITDALTLGGTWQVCTRLNLFAEYAYEAWRAKSEMTAFPTLDNFLPNSRLTSLGLNWAIDRRNFLSLAFTELATANDNPLLLRDGNYLGRFLTGVWRHRFPAGYELALTVAPWRYRDRVVNWMDYEAMIVMISGMARF